MNATISYTQPFRRTIRVFGDLQRVELRWHETQNFHCKSAEHSRSDIDGALGIGATVEEAIADFCRDATRRFGQGL
jgi:poly(3-hydroxybutyrate) depolymerase